MKSKLSIAVLLALFQAGLSGADQNVSVKFRVLGPGLPPGAVEFVQKGKPVRLALQPDARSVVQTYKGPADIILQEAAPGTRRFSTTLPDTKDLLLLLLTKSAEGQPEIRIIKEDLKSFPMGSTLIVNSGTIPLSLHVGAEEFELAAGEMKVVAAPAAAARTCFVQIFRDGPDGKESVFSNNWASNPLMRTLLVLSNDASQPPKVTSLRISEAKPVIGK